MNDFSNFCSFVSGKESKENLSILWQRTIKTCQTFETTTQTGRSCEGCNESARLPLQEWREAVDGAWVYPTILVQNIQDPLEKALFDKFKLAYNAGKGSKKLVPILIPNDTVKPIMTLTEQRKEVGISDANPFLIANTGSSLDHAIGWQL